MTTSEIVGGGRPDYVIRPYDPSDAGAVVDLVEVARAAEAGVPKIDLARWRYLCSDPYADPETHFRIAEDRSGRILGFAYRLDPPRGGGAKYRALYVLVDPEYRRRGVGKSLYDAVSAEPSEFIDEGWFITTSLDDTVASGFAFGRSLNFKKDRSILVMRRELPGRPLPEPDCDAHLERFLGPTAYTDWAHIHNRAFANAPGLFPTTADELEEQRPDGFRPEHLRFARLGNDRVGFIYVRESSSGGFIESIGVLPDAQGRNIGTQLLVTSLEYLVERGHRSVELFVDEKNMGAITLYTRLEFEVVARRTTLIKRFKMRRRAAAKMAS